MKTNISIFMIMAFFCGLLGQANAQDRNEIEWPSEEFPTLQSAVDALTDGGKLKIAPGVHEIETGVFIRSKRLTIEGAGCNELRRKNNKDSEGRRTRFTQLVGPTPTEVADPDSSIGLFNFVDSGGVVKDLMFIGFDAGIVVKGETPKPLLIQDSCIMKTTRGVFARDPQVTLKHCLIKEVLWNGISVAPLVAGLQAFAVLDTTIESAGNACIVFKNTFGIKVGGILLGCGPAAGIGVVDSQAILEDVSVVNQAGPGVIFVKSTGYVNNFTTNGTTFAGILLSESGVTIVNSFFRGTLPSSLGTFGDGIVAILSSITLSSNRIWENARTGVSNFGGFVSLTDNKMWDQGAKSCPAGNGFDIEGESFSGQNFTFHDGNGNKCDCNFPPSGNCSAATLGITPPQAVAPLE